MNLHLLPPVIGCLALGLASSAAAPASWGVGAGHGLLLGGALYAGGLRRFLAHAQGADGDGGARSAGRLYGGVALRVAAFLLFAAFQAIAYFEWLPGTDLRWTFVVLSTWVTIETLMEPRAAATASSSPRA